MRILCTTLVYAYRLCQPLTIGAKIGIPDRYTNRNLLSCIQIKGPGYVAIPASTLWKAFHKSLLCFLWKCVPTYSV